MQYIEVLLQVLSKVVNMKRSSQQIIIYFQHMTFVLKVTSMIKQLLAEVVKLKFSRPDSMLFNLIPVPLNLVGRAGWLAVITNWEIPTAGLP